MAGFKVDITRDFPFAGCSKCKFMDAEAHKDDIYANNEIYIRQINVYCRNEDLCKNAVEMAKEEE